MRERWRLEARGAVQGVGFRPFVYRLARESGLDGFVANDPRGAAIEVEGPLAKLEGFVARLEAELPPPAAVHQLRRTRIAPGGERGFRILASTERGERTAQVLADLATCEACLAEVLDPADRRHAYPFANCTRCGPRFSIVRALPWDRPNTTMERFALCPACRAEYEDPRDRRFHAQPNACPACGPRLALWAADGRVLGGDPLEGAARALCDGAIVAVKGLGGFHLMADAADGAAVTRLRSRKPRREKPFALMVRDLAQARALCRVDAAATQALASPEAPILLLPRRPGAPVHESVAPGNPYLGVMLPATPLHHLLLRRVGRPLVATSGNLSEEPICTDERDALARLAGIADLLLVHDRPIARHVDDSVAWIAAGETRLLRRARGFAPRPVPVEAELPPLLAVGGHLKSSVALGVGRQVFVSQHLGDLETPEALGAFERVIEDFLRLYEVAPVAVAHDLHPDYASTRWALASGLRCIPVQHHHAHLAACLAENGCAGPVLGVVWDGTGYGPDGTIWGGEFLVGSAAGFRRVAHLRPFRLPGGDAAVREPRRSALALLHEIGEEIEPEVLRRMIEKGIHAPLTSSAGRLFDGVAALVGPWQRTSFEGQAAMGLEHLVDPAVGDAYPLDVVGEELDWRPLVEALLDDRRRGAAPGAMAARFHNALVEGIVAVARAVGEPAVALSGGCFQNRVLLERAAARLAAEGFRVLLHRHVPPSDGGISLGQVAVAAARLDLH